MNCATLTRSNAHVFQLVATGSPKHALFAHLTALGSARPARFCERRTVTGEVSLAVNGDTAPLAQPDEKARIGQAGHGSQMLMASI
jgi:hypothetical protein